jgi:hypothetical protein
LLITLTCVAGLIGGAALIVLGVGGFGNSPNLWVGAFGGFALLSAVLWLAVSSILLKIESSINRQAGDQQDLVDTLRQHSTLLEAIAQNTRISDAAKSLARRDEELEAVRSAIREDIRTERWEAAFTLIDHMEHRFGYREEAARSRQEIIDARDERIQAKLQEAIQMIEGHFAVHAWARAQHEIERLLHALPDDARVLALQSRMNALKTEHKQELRMAWDDAVRRSDTDRAIDVLKELDQYLSPGEAQVLQSAARHVFKEKLLQLGVQFRFAVSERRWQDALDIGLELIRDFPNSRMANEVREVMDTLRERARTQTDVQPTAAG